MRHQQNGITTISAASHHPSKTQANAVAEVLDMAPLLLALKLERLLALHGWLWHLSLA
jgi:hypothetical protein